MGVPFKGSYKYGMNVASGRLPIRLQKMGVPPEYAGIVSIAVTALPGLIVAWFCGSALVEIMPALAHSVIAGHSVIESIATGAIMLPLFGVPGAFAAGMAISGVKNIFTGVVTALRAKQQKAHDAQPGGQAPSPASTFNANATLFANFKNAAAVAPPQGNPPQPSGPATTTAPTV